MKGALNEDTFFATVAMARNGTARLILVVEGDDDYLLIEPHANPRQLVVIQGVGGRSSVLSVAQRIEEESIDGIRVLVDADYGRFVDADRGLPGNVIASTNHDAMIDIVLLSPRLLTRIVDTHCRTARRNGATIDTKKVCSDAFQLAAALAPLRIVNERRKYELRLADFPFGRVSSTTPSSMELASLAVGRSRTSVTADALAAEVDEEQSKIEAGDLRIVGDHDYFAALASVLAFSGANISSKALWSGFLGAVTCEHVARPAWFAEIRDWGLANSRELFACPCPT